MVVLGIDFGSKRIGLAISDAQGQFAFPIAILERRSIESDLRALHALIQERKVERIVVGLPLRLSGAKAREARIVTEFASRLASESGLPIDLFDERLTTVEAQRALRECRVPSRRHKKTIDSIAAAILLRTYLAQRSAIHIGGDPTP